jgi:hypothetical protein
LFFILSHFGVISPAHQASCLNTQDKIKDTAPYVGLYIRCTQKGSFTSSTSSPTNTARPRAAFVT